MKSKLLTLSLIAVSITAMAQYHIRVECYGRKSFADDYQFYVINFTNNNWATSDNIKGSDKVTQFATNSIDDMRSYTDVDYMVRLETDRNSLVSIAKGLKSYNDCLKFNKAVYDYYVKMHSYYMKIKPIFKPLKPKPLYTDRQCCKITNIY